MEQERVAMNFFRLAKFLISITSAYTIWKTENKKKCFDFKFFFVLMIIKL